MHSKPGTAYIDDVRFTSCWVIRVASLWNILVRMVDLVVWVELLAMIWKSRSSLRKLALLEIGRIVSTMKWVHLSTLRANLWRTKLLIGLINGIITIGWLYHIDAIIFWLLKEFGVLRSKFAALGLQDLLMTGWLSVVDAFISTTWQIPSGALRSYWTQRNLH